MGLMLTHQTDRGLLFIALVLLVCVLFIEWKLIARYARIENEDLAHVEYTCSRLPHTAEILGTNMLTILFLVTFVQFISVAYAQTFTLYSSTSEAETTQRVFATDFDADGDIDYVSINGNASASHLSNVYLNDGNGNYTAQADFGPDGLNVLGDVGDIDGDGDADIVLTLSGNYYKYTNNGSASFSESTIATSSFTATDMRLMDVDNDGDLDIVRTGGSTIFINNGSGTFSTSPSTIPGTIAGIADFNSDGYPDIAISGAGKIYKNSGTGAFIPVYTGTSSGPGIVADLDGDGDLDMALAESPDVKVYKNDGTGTSFATATFTTGNAQITTIGQGDFDNDGDVDLLVGGEDYGASGIGGTEMYANNGTATFTLANDLLGSGRFTKYEAPADIDGDGDLDFIEGNGINISGQANRHYKNDQAATSVNTAPSAPSTGFGVTVSSLNNNIVTVSSSGDVGKYSSMAMGSDGFPIISYFDETNGLVKVTKCGNITCSSGNTTSTIAAVSIVTGFNTAIRVPSDGLPVIAYSAINRLRFVKCGNAACSSGNTITAIGTSGTEGLNVSIAFATSDGLPVVAYRSASTSLDLEIIKCGDASCTSGNTQVVVDGNINDFIGYHTSIAIPSDGLPAISYYSVVGGSSVYLRFAKCGDATCSSGNTLTTVDNNTSVGLYSSMTIPADDLPVIAYWDATNKNLKVAKCGNAACSSGNTLTAVDSTGDVGYFPSIGIAADGMPIISYTDVTNSRLKVVKCGNATCAAGNTMTVIDSIGAETNYEGLTALVVPTADNRPLVAYYTATSSDLKFVRCGLTDCSTGGSNGAGLIVKLSWGSGSDAQTSTRLLQYQLKIGTTSGYNNTMSSKTASPSYVTRLMPNGQSRSFPLKGLPCTNLYTYYWSVAAVDTGFKSTWSSERTFVLDSECNPTTSEGSGSSNPVTTAGGGLDFRIFKPKDESGGGGDLYRLTVSAVSDVNGNRKRDSREQTLALKGLEVTASGTSLAGLPVRKTASLSSTGVAIFDLPISGPRGYSIFFDDEALAKTGYKATGALTLTGIVLRPSLSTTVATNLTVTLPFRRDDLLRYAPCLTVGDPPENEAPGTDAEILLQRLRDPYGKNVLGNISLSGSLMTRGDFFTLLQRTQCVALETNRAILSAKLKSAAQTLKENISPIDVFPNATADSLMVYSLLGTGADILRSTTIGPAADLSSPITRVDAMRAVASIVRVPKALVTETGSELLPLDIEPTTTEAADFFALRSIGALPQNFIGTPGVNQGITSSEAALLIARAAFRNGKISLLPDVQNPKTAKKTPLVPTFLKDLPTIKARTCLERHEERSTALSFVDLLPGDPRHADIRDLLSRGIVNAADQMLWLIPGNLRPTEFGVTKGQSRLGIDEPISVLETVRNLLVFACLAPDTRTQALAGLSVKEVIQGTGETRTARDRLSNLPRDASFASRVMYRAQDRLKEFDLSLVRYAPALLLEETRLPGASLNLKDASDLMASALLMTMVRQSILSPQRAEELEGAVSAAISRQLLGKEVNWRDEGMLKNTVFTRGMLLEFLATALQNRKFVSTQKITSLLPLGEIWWERVK